MQSAGRDPCLLTDEWLHMHPLTDGANFLVCKVSMLSYLKVSQHAPALQLAHGALPHHPART